MLIRVLMLGIFAASLANAQRGGGRGMRDDTSGGMGITPMPRQSKSEQIADKLKLNKEQKEELQQILAAGSEEAAPLRSVLSSARVEYASALISGKTEADVKRTKDAITEAEAQMTAVEAKAFGKIYALLKPNQQARASQAFELMAGMFFQGGGRGPGGGMGRQHGR